MTLEELKAAFPETEHETLELARGVVRDFDAFVPVVWRDQELRLPAGNSLWRGLQFWGMVTGRLSIDYSRFCLAGNCRNCEMTIQRLEGEPWRVLACQTLVEAGMRLLELPEGFEGEG